MKIPNIFSDIGARGFVVFSLKNADPNYYPGASNNFPGVSLKALKIYDIITIKVFITDGKVAFARIIDDFIDLTIKSIGDGRVIAEVLTELPEDFHFKTGSSLKILEEEILYHIPVGDELKDRTVN